MTTVALAQSPLAVGIDWTPILATVLGVIVCEGTLIPGTHTCVRVVEEDHPLELDKPVVKTVGGFNPQLTTEETSDEHSM